MKKRVITVMLSVMIVGGVATIALNNNMPREIIISADKNSGEDFNEEENKDIIENNNSDIELDTDIENRQITNNLKRDSGVEDILQNEDLSNMEENKLELDLNYNEGENSQIIPQQQENIKPDSTVQPEVEIKPEITVKPEVNTKPEITVKPESNIEPEVNPQPEVSPQPEVTPQPEVEQSSAFMDQVESMIIVKVNEERSKVGLAPLAINNTMKKYARIKSQDMGDRNYFDHNNPEGELITAQMKRDGVTYMAWGENIAYISGQSDATALANQFMNNWMNSSGHRANILSDNFTDIGVGVYKIGNKVYATQEFYR